MRFSNCLSKGFVLLILIAQCIGCASRKNSFLITEPQQLKGLTSSKEAYPHIFFSSWQDVLDLRKKVKSQEKGAIGYSAATIWAKVKQRADEYVDESKVDFDFTIMSCFIRGQGKPHNYQFQMDFVNPQGEPPRHRDCGSQFYNIINPPIYDRLVTLSFAYLISEKEAYKQRALTILEQVSQWSYWSDPDGVHCGYRAGICFDIAYITSGVAIALDFLSFSLSNDQLAMFRVNLYEKGFQRIAKAVLNQKNVDDYFWDNGFLRLVATLGYGVPLYEQTNPKLSKRWLRGFKKVLELTTSKSIGQDGGWSEGHFYGSRTFNLLAPTLLAIKDRAGISGLIKKMEKLVDYGFYSLTPDGKALSHFSDSNASPRWEPFMKLYATMGNPLALAYLRKAAEKLNKPTFFDLLTMSSSNHEKISWDKFEKIKFFRDIGEVTMRSGWENYDTFIAFKSAGPSRHNGIHLQRDNNTFHLYSDGQWLLTDPGYSVPPNRKKKPIDYLRYNTIGHSGLMLTKDSQSFENMPEDGLVKYGQDKTIANGIQLVKHKGNYLYAVGHADAGYPDELNLSKQSRTFLFDVKNDWFIILDEVICRDDCDASVFFHVPLSSMKQLPDRKTWSIDPAKGKSKKVLVMKALLDSSTSVVEHQFKAGKKVFPLLRYSNLNAAKKHYFITFFQLHRDQQQALVKATAVVVEELNAGDYVVRCPGAAITIRADNPGGIAEIIVSPEQAEPIRF